MAENRPLEFPADPTTGWPVWGQPSAIAELDRALQRGPNHAWVFFGPDGSGRLAAARAFAKALCCATPRDGYLACGTCSVCHRIDRGVFPDVTVFNLEAQAARDRERTKNLTLNISTVREVAASVAYRPSEASWRIIIVEDVETMQETAQEAFLKTLEEPPAYAVIILLTAETDSLLPTILSRTTQVRFAPVASGAISRALTACDADDAKARRLAELANGSIDWALAALRTPQLAEEREAELQRAWELVGASEFDRMVLAVRIADQFVADREGTYAFLGKVQAAWRSLLYQKAGVGTAMQPRLAPGDNIQLADIVRSVNAVSTCIENLSANVRPRLALESMVLQWVRLA